MMVWEFATAVAGRLLGINPFDQPDVEAAKVAARGLLDAQPEPTPADFTDGAIEVRGGGLARRAAPLPRRRSAPCSASSAPRRLPQRPGLLRPPRRTPRWKASADQLAAVTGRPVTFGWGPRFLHSTGQFHKGGPAIGVFLQVTAAPATDLADPGPAVHLR